MILAYPGTLAGPEKLFDILSGHTVILLDDTDLDQTMESLMKKTPSSKNTAEGTQPPFLFFVDTDIKEISRLQSLIEKDCPEISAMAAATDNNRQWKLRDLIQEVEQEAAYFQKLDHLSNLVQYADPVLMEKNPKYARGVLAAYSMLKSQDLPEDGVNFMISLLEEQLQEAQKQ